MCAKTHSTACSAEALFTAMAARRLPFSLNPIDITCATMASSASGGAAASDFFAASASSSAMIVSSGCAPFARRCSSDIVSGMGTSASSFLGVQSEAT